MPIGPKEDPFHAAARYALEGDWEGAYNSIREKWIEDITDDYTPDYDADEDGETMSDPNDDMRRRAETQLDGYLDQSIGDAVYAILAPEGDDDVADAEAMQKAEEISKAVQQNFQQYVENVADTAADEWKDNYAYSGDKYAYYGVKRSDFF